MLEQLRMYWRLGTGLRGFLKEPINLEQARNVIKQRLAEREKNLLTIVKRGIFENERSPYQKPSKHTVKHDEVIEVSGDCSR